jgi:tetratricopeptide (TPR) repeat protein
VSRADGEGAFAGDPAELLPLVFSRPRQALAGARAVLASAPAPYGASVAYQVIGLVERDFGDAPAALGHLRHAARLARRSGSRDREADVLAALGVALIHCGRTAAGLRVLQTAVTLSDGLTAARVRFRLAGALWVLGRHDEALDELRPVISALRRAGDTIWVARALTLRGLLQLARGVTDRADRDFDAAEQLFTTTGQEHDSAVAVHNRGQAAFRAGALPAALRYLDEADRRYLALGTPMPELAMDRCGVLLAAGLARDALAEADRAIAQLDRLRGQPTRRAELLLTAARAALAAGDPGVAGIRARAAGRLFAAQRRGWWSAHAQLLFLQSRLASEPAGEGQSGGGGGGGGAGGVGGLVRVAEAVWVAERLTALGSAEAPQARLLAGRAALRLGRPAAAQGQLAIAARARHRGPALARASGWLAAALLAESAGQTRRTLAACRAGLTVLRAHSLTLGATELRAQATAHGLELAELAQRVCLRTGSTRQLLVWSERWRATAVAVPLARPPADRELLTDLARYREATSRLESAQSAGRPTSGLQREQRQWEERVRTRQLRMPGPARPRPGRAGPAVMAGPGSAVAAADRPLAVRDLLTELGDGQLAEIIEVDGGLHVVLCGRGRVRRFGLGAAADVAQEVEYARWALRRLAYGASARPEQALARLEAAGGRLQELLLGAAVRHLGDGPLVLVPPGRLHGVPWAILPALTGRAFTVAPSARGWLRARATVRSVPGDVLVVGGPGLGTGAAELTAVSELWEPRGGQATAPRVTAGPPGGQATAPRVTVLLGGQATAPRVLDALDGTWLAHIAAHGTFRADSPLFSSLRMDDGPLTVHDFERLRRAPYRLVLPCCDSGRLATAGADELLGLTAALLPLGTAGVVASVGPVNDQATVEVMLALHDGLRQGLTTAGALARARAAAARSGPLATATAWSFVAFGAA